MPRARIGRYENPYQVVEWHREPPAGTRTEPINLFTADGAIAHGWLYSRGGEDTVVSVMHPRANFSHHYLVPGLLERGFAVFCENSRWLNNDATLIHERLLLDVAAGVGEMRKRFDRVVLCGNSGGGSLYTFYLSQALAAPGSRLSATATGEPFDLNRYELPAADALAYVAAHPGEGHFLMHAIDPSLVEEGDPLSCDPSLDMYDPSNGFAEPPEESRYDGDFLERYRAAQRARVARIDAIARGRLARRRAARARFVASRDPADRRAAVATDFLLIYRTDADPRYTDLSIDPSERDYGSLWGVRPDVINYGAIGFGRVVSPEAWLSTWSGLSSHADLARWAPGVTLPCLMVSYSGDNAIFPSDDERIAGAVGSRSFERVRLPGDHYGYPVEAGREGAVEALSDWLRRAG